MSDIVRGLEHTPLHDLHLRLEAKMVPFAGFAMPLNFPTGVLQEHLHTRRAAGLFDVSHMGQIIVASRDGSMVDAALALESLIPIDILGLVQGRQRYGFFTDDRGGIEDDLMVAHLGDRFLVVVNASCKVAGEQYLRSRLSHCCSVEMLPRALLALQGPGAEAALVPFAPEIAAMEFMDVRAMRIRGVPCLVSRSGYTGEDGFEISTTADGAEEIAQALLADPNVKPIGLGARDSLRLEAGLCLSGSDIDVTRTPVQAGLGWAIGGARRRGGSRAGGFPGAAVIHDEFANGAQKRRVGLRAEGRAPVRAGAALHVDETDAAVSGTVTSGGFSPTLGAPVAMGYVPPALAWPGMRVFAEVRGNRLPMIVTRLPFVPTGFKRAGSSL